MPKYLPCGVCHAPALATKGGKGGKGILHTAGMLSSPSISYLCKRCGQLTTLTAAAFQFLPEMTREEIAAETCDLQPDPD